MREFGQEGAMEDDGDEPDRPKKKRKNSTALNPAEVKDTSGAPSYKPMWDRSKFEHKNDVDEWAKFQKEDSRLTEIMQIKNEWIKAQEEIKKSYYKNAEEEKFDEFIIHGTIAAISFLIIMICLCFCCRRCCTRSLVVDRRDME